MPVQALLLVAITASVMFTHLGSARLWDRDEPRNAGCAAEMMQRGNYVVPVFNDELRPQKPVLIYWLIISAYQVFGISEFSARFWSALLAIGTVLATWGIGRRLLAREAGLYAGISLATSMMFVVAGRAATPDSVLVFCSTMAMLFYVLGTFAPRADAEEPATPRQQCRDSWFPAQYRFVVAMYTMMGLAVLAKGPVGFIVPCAIVGMFMLLMRLPPIDADFWQRQGWIVRIAAAMGRPFAPRHFLGTLWLMRPISLAAIVLAIAAPWYLAVGFQTMGDWPRSFFLNENLARAATSLESHQGGWWYYPLSIMLGFFPASVFFGPMLVRLDRQMTAGSQGAPATLLMVCWVGVQVGLFTLAKTKLPSYVTPSYPALALLTGAYLAKYSRRQFADGLRIDRWPAWGLLVSGVGIMVALAVVGHRFLEGSWQIGLMGVVLVAGAGLMLWLEGSGQSGMAANAYCGTAFLFAVSIFGWGTVTVDRHRQSQRVLEQVAHNPAPVFGTFNCLESSWVYYGGKPAFELTVDYQDGVWYDGRKHDWLKKDWPSPEQFARAYPEALIITTNEHVAELGLRLPQYEVLERARYFLKEQDMVVLGRRNPGAERSTNRRSDSRALR